MTGDAWPCRLTFKKSDRELRVVLDDGRIGTIAYKTLRQESPSAENKGHGGAPPPPQAPIDPNLDVTGAEPIGRYAVRIEFSDGHTTGIYTWGLLRRLAKLD
ncbi:MAG: DUF971 domain-containing protein [Pseudomonadota bacterium]